MAAKPRLTPPQITKNALTELAESFAKGKYLNNVLAGVDNAAKSVGVNIGKALSKNPSWSSLGWLWGQYRGTILSGHRAFAEFFHRSGLGSSDENMVLLGIYWHAYGLQATFGELFDQRCVAQEFELTNGEVHLDARSPFWKTLVVTPYDASRGRVGAVSYEEVSTSTRSEVRLQVPRDWAQLLVPEDFRNIVKGLTSKYKAYRASASPDEADTKQDGGFERIREFLKNDEKAYKRLQTKLKCRRELLAADILWSDSLEGNKITRDAIKRFFKPLDARFIELPEYDEEDAVGRFVTAVQLLSLYWSWASLKERPHNAKIGSLLVCVPKPHKNGTAQGLQPRLGFAALFTGNHGQALRSIDKVLEKWGDFLDKASDKILRTSGVRKNGFVEEAEFVVGKEIAAKLVKRTAELHLGGEIGAIILLQRLRRVLAEIDRIAPTLVHEGQRFSISLLIGLSYHGQVLGEPLGAVNEFLDNLSVFRPGTNEAITHLDCLKALVSSCYSLLDWDGVVLFGTFGIEKDEDVTFSSLLRLGEAERHASGIALFRSLTLKNRELAAISVDRDGTIRLFFAGTLLLYKQKGAWRLGSAVEVLRQTLVESLRVTGVLPGLTNPADALDSFVDLLLRISEEPGHGAMFVICSEGVADKYFSFIAEPPLPIWENLRPFSSDKLESGDGQVLYRLAIMDGATLIDLDPKKDFPARWKEGAIKPRRLVGAKFDLETFKKTWKNGTWNNWRDVYSFGAKHSSALALAMAARSHKPPLPLLVITVSADGPISFVKGGPDPIVRWP